MKSRQNYSATRRSYDLKEENTPINAAKEKAARQELAVDTLEDQLKLTDASFDPNSEDLLQGWWANSANILCINCYPNGITLSQHRPKGESDLSAEHSELALRPHHFYLRYRDMREYLLPEGKYFLYKEDYLVQLEDHLSQMRKSGLLEKTVVILGNTADPFFALNKKFEVTMNCLGLLENYKPGLVVLQTRSPMVIAALPFVKCLEDRTVVAMCVETFREDVISRYTPGQATIRERLVACEGLRAQDLKVQLVVSPILPYGDYYRDAWKFAEILNRHADYISVGCLASGLQSDEVALRSLPLAQKLEADGHLKILRPHAYRHLYYVLKNAYAEKLKTPVNDLKAQPAQLNLFAA
ncbi:MAG: hypothetical protein IT292_11510 [Deltaproteobacteria bacterium]|nr:hypothetical protein [Deltaproteobacteria bacterium]